MFLKMVIAVTQKGEPMSEFRFPTDCPFECKYHKAWDLSVDDWTHVCTKLNIQIDEYADGG